MIPIVNLNTTAPSSDATGLSKLSPELVRVILELLPWCHLTSASLVCRQWQTMVFPLLHSTIRLFTNQDWFNMIDEALNDSLMLSRESNLLKSRDCVRRLWVGRFVAVDDHRPWDLVRAMERMPKLKYLYWDVKNVDGWRGVVANMTGLWSLAVHVPPDDFPLNEADVTMKVPHDLRELSIIFGAVVTSRSEDELLRYEQGWDRPDEIFASAAGLLNGASNIESLSIRLQDSEWHSEGPYHWKTTELVSLLSQKTYPNLRSIRFSARIWTDSNASTLSGLFTELALWKFLDNHQLLRTVVLDTDCEDYSSRLVEGMAEGNVVVIPPDRITSLMPSVQHFEGPCMMFGALILSNISQQIEILGLIESGAPELGMFQQLLSKLGGLIIPEFPHLKCLKVYAANLNVSEGYLDNFVFLVKKMPVLESLVVGFSLTMGESHQRDPDSYLKLLEALPRLRKLALQDLPLPRKMRGREQRQGTPTWDLKSFFMRIGQLCPELKSVYWGEEKSPDWGYRGRWDIIRQGDGGTPVDVVFVCCERSHKKPVGWMGTVVDYEGAPFWPNDFFYNNEDST